MITGFNTDVHYDGRVYHVQTEDRGREHPVLESLVYVGGTIIAKKLTRYDEQLEQGATEEMIASLLRRQHQVMIAAVKAGRIEDLTKHPDRDQFVEEIEAALSPLVASKSTPSNVTTPKAQAKTSNSGRLNAPQPQPPQPPPPETVPKPRTTGSGPLVPASSTTLERAVPSGLSSPAQPSASPGGMGLDLDQVISDYLKRSAEQGRLDLKVLSPSLFTAGKTIALRVQVTRGDEPEIEAIVTVKIIGTAFKPQVHIARTDSSGNSSFNLELPSFTAGTAAIVIEAQSNRGRGELKHLIRRS